MDAYQMLQHLFDGYSSFEVAEFFVDHRHWPADYTPSVAAARVRACNNPDKSEYWKLSELVDWCEHTGRTTLLFWICDRLGYERPSPLGANEELSRIQQELSEIDNRRRELLQEAMQYMPQSASDTQKGDRVPESVAHARFQRGGRHGG